MNGGVISASDNERISGGTILGDDAAAVVRDVRFIDTAGQRAYASTLARVVRVVRVVRGVRVVRADVARVATGLAVTREREADAARRGWVDRLEVAVFGTDFFTSGLSGTRWATVRAEARLAGFLAVVVAVRPFTAVRFVAVRFALVGLATLFTVAGFSVASSIDFTDVWIDLIAFNAVRLLA